MVRALSDTFFFNEIYKSADWLITKHVLYLKKRDSVKSNPYNRFSKHFYEWLV